MLGVAFGVLTQPAATGLILIMLGAIQKKTFVCFEDGANGGQLMKMPAAGGNAEQVSQELVVPGFDISPDSKLVAFACFGHLYGHVEKLHVADLDSNQIVKTMDFEHPRNGPIRFSHDGKAVVYPVYAGVADNLWVQPLDGSPGKQITEFTSERIIDFHWSPDGKPRPYPRSR